MEKNIEKIFQSLGMSQNRCWYVLYVFSRKEKKINQLFLKAGLNSYLPLLKLKKQWSDRKKWVEEPLFRGYVFVNADLNELADCLKTPGVLYLVKFQGEPAVLNDKDIQNIKLSLSQAELVSVTNQRFLMGEKVTVTHGPFKGLQAKVIRQSGKMKLQVEIEAIQQTLVLEIPAGFVIQYDKSSEFSAHSI